MKVAFFGYDFSFSTLQRLMMDGHDIVQVFSFPTDNIFMFNAHLQALCEAGDIPFQVEKVTLQDIEGLIEQGCEVIVSAGYLYKIPPLDDAKIYGVNIHPTYLPHGRGMLPLPHIILEHPEHAGISAHKIIPEYDMGDILAQEKIDVMADEDIETLGAKISMRMPDLASKVLADLKAFWDGASAQNKNNGSWLEPHSKADMTLNWNDTVDHINGLHRAFGRYGMLAQIADQSFAVFNLKAWAEEHTHTAGDVVAVLSREVVVAIADGYVILKEFQNIDAQSAEG